MLHLGIDVAKEDLQASVLLPDGKHRDRSFPNSSAGIAALLVWAGTTEPLRVYLEATGKLHRLPVRLLSEAGAEVVRMNPRQARYMAMGLGRLDKSDKVDARVLARCASLGLATARPLPTAFQERLQDLSRRIDALTKTRSAEKVRLKEPSTAPEARESSRRTVEFLDGEIKTLETQWTDLAHSDGETSEKVGLLRSIAGIGVKTARVLASELPDGVRPRQAAAYAGVVPRENSSGSSVHKPARTKGGNARVRRALFLAAGVLVNHDLDARGLYDRIVESGKNRRQALVAVANKLARWVAAVLLRKTPWIPTEEMWGKP